MWYNTCVREQTAVINSRSRTLAHHRSTELSSDEVDRDVVTLKSSQEHLAMIPFRFGELFTLGGRPSSQRWSYTTSFTHTDSLNTPGSLASAGIKIQRLSRAINTRTSPQARHPASGPQVSNKPYPRRMKALSSVTNRHTNMCWKAFLGSRMDFRPELWPELEDKTLKFPACTRPF